MRQATAIRRDFVINTPIIYLAVVDLSLEKLPFLRGASRTGKRLRNPTATRPITVLPPGDIDVGGIHVRLRHIRNILCDPRFFARFV